MNSRTSEISSKYGRAKALSRQHQLYSYWHRPKRSNGPATVACPRWSFCKLSHETEISKTAGACRSQRRPDKATKTDREDGFGARAPRQGKRGAINRIGRDAHDGGA
jgi:hypothetical protein